MLRTIEISIIREGQKTISKELNTKEILTSAGIAVGLFVLGMALSAGSVATMSAWDTVNTINAFLGL